MFKRSPANMSGEEGSSDQNRVTVRGGPAMSMSTETNKENSNLVEQSTTVGPSSRRCIKNHGEDVQSVPIPSTDPVQTTSVATTPDEKLISSISQRMMEMKLDSSSNSHVHATDGGEVRSRSPNCAIPGSWTFSSNRTSLLVPDSGRRFLEASTSTASSYLPGMSHEASISNRPAVYESSSYQLETIPELIHMPSTSSGHPYRGMSKDGGNQPVPTPVPYMFPGAAHSQHEDTGASSYASGSTVGSGVSTASESNLNGRRFYGTIRRDPRTIVGSGSDNRNAASEFRSLRNLYRLWSRTLAHHKHAPIVRAKLRARLDALTDRNRGSGLLRLRFRVLSSRRRNESSRRRHPRRSGPGGPSAHGI